jgi:hypothetical protein
MQIAFAELMLVSPLMEVLGQLVAQINEKWQSLLLVNAFLHYDGRVKLSKYCIFLLGRL